MLPGWNKIFMCMHNLKEVDYFFNLCINVYCYLPTVKSFMLPSCNGITIFGWKSWNKNHRSHPAYYLFLSRWIHGLAIRKEFWFWIEKTWYPQQTGMRGQLILQGRERRLSFPMGNLEWYLNKGSSFKFP